MDEQQKLLTAAREALDRDAHTEAEALLRQLLDDAPYVADAWYMLSFALDPDLRDDQITCLRNALVADPEHQEAGARLDTLTEAGVTTAAWASKRHEKLLDEARDKELEQFVFMSKVDAYGADSLDDPMQCPYCGTVNPEENKRCLHCGQSIMYTAPKSEAPGPSLQTAVLLAGISGILGLFELSTGLLWQWFVTLDESSWLHTAAGGALGGDGGKFLFGDVLSENSIINQMAWAIVIIGVMRLVLMAVFWSGVRQRWRWGYYGGLTISVLDILLQVTLGLLSLAGPMVATGAGMLSAGAIIMLFTSKADFAFIQSRYQVQPDLRVKSAAAFFKRGTKHKNKKMWALAVVNWRKAVGLAPRNAEYYRWLGVGYMELKRYDRALPVLEEAQRIRPDNPEYAKLLAMLRDIMAEEAEEKARSKAESAPPGEVIAPLWD